MKSPKVTIPFFHALFPSTLPPYKTEAALNAELNGMSFKTTHSLSTKPSFKRRSLSVIIN
jgi:hypothetical protein